MSGPTGPPVIGISAYVEPASWAVWRAVPAVLVPLGYVRHVRDAGGLPVLLPPLPAGSDEALAAALLGRLDGLVIAGGVDVEPGRYGADPHPTVQPPRPDRDSTELAFAGLSADRDLPVLGVCRGMQVMCVQAGGRLEQHLPDRVGHDDHAPAPGAYGEHRVRTVAGTRLAEVLGEQVAVPTYHHQGLAEHPGLTPAAWSDDGVLEAVEVTGARFRVGVQWHPEVGDDPRLFEALVAAARPR
ncbi:MAG: gamma-glutamyl-gamma-aminobutyrate hydrolase family protein [Nocardioidaceae bacterium]|nr:gamma-glutamyl-gamma-aminobutyrate hydrolase family protein [Nocardioidaceae bacterium]